MSKRQGQSLDGFMRCATCMLNIDSYVKKDLIFFTFERPSFYESLMSVSVFNFGIITWTWKIDSWTLRWSSNE